MLNASSNDGEASPNLELLDYWFREAPAQPTPSWTVEPTPAFHGAVNPDGGMIAWQHVSPTLQPIPLPIDYLDFAAPLAPLRDRDISALADFFEREDMPYVEQDLTHHLLLLFPEPCWEEEDLEFLREYL